MSAIEQAQGGRPVAVRRGAQRCGGPLVAHQLGDLRQLVAAVGITLELAGACRSAVGCHGSSLGRRRVRPAA